MEDGFVSKGERSVEFAVGGRRSDEAAGSGEGGVVDGGDGRRWL